MRFLVTGTAGFIGYHLAERLLRDGHTVVGFDGMTDYYDVALKRARVARLERHGGFRPVVGLLEDGDLLLRTAEAAEPEVIVHLAAQAGVRYGLENPRAYVDGNLVGSFAVLEAARLLKPRHLLLASTSSVYGAGPEVPFREASPTDAPLSLYAATKKAMEVMAHSYAHLWAIPTTAFRFFTVYGPWGRPDMALFRFVAAILEDREIPVYGYGRMRRDFTYVDDLIEAVVRLIDRPPGAGRVTADVPDSLSASAPFRTVNIGGGQPVGLEDFIAAIETALDRPAKRLLLPMQPGDVPETFASPDLLQALTGYRPRTGIDEGVARFVAWYRAYTASARSA